MLHCLNPKKAHEQRDIPVRSVATGTSTVPVATSLAEVEAPVACQYCPYLLAGAVLGNCRLLRWIGSGRFGDVYEAEQLPPLNRRVAIKVLSIERTLDSTSARMFANEISTIAALDHPNILPALSAGTLDDGRSYLVMKYAAQGSLQQFCQPTHSTRAQLPPLLAEAQVVTPEPRDAGHTQASRHTILAEIGQPAPASVSGQQQSSPTAILSPQQVLGYLQEAAEALQYAHQRGLIHLDVKPANLLLDAQGRLLLADFGVSALLEGSTHASLHYYAGTPLYTAPEQWLEQPRPASDQYALAVTCYQLLTGHLPFTGSLYAVMHGHLQVLPPPPDALNPLIPPAVAAVLQRALAKDPAARYPGMLAFAAAYRQALEDSTDTQSDDPLASSPPELHLLMALPPPDTPQAPPAAEQGALPRPQRRSRASYWQQTLLVLELIFLLIGAGSLGFVRALQPCWLGLCPQISLSITALTLTDNATGSVMLTNTGASDLHWQVHVNPAHFLLTLTPTSGTLPSGRSRLLTIRAYVGQLDQSGEYSASIDLLGDRGVLPQRISITERVTAGTGQLAASIRGVALLSGQGLWPPVSANHETAPLSLPASGQMKTPADHQPRREGSATSGGAPAQNPPTPLHRRPADQAPESLQPLAPPPPAFSHWWRRQRRQDRPRPGVE